MFDIMERILNGDHLVVPTNGVVKKDGKLVMGKGLAKVVKENFVSIYEEGIDKVLGELVSDYGINLTLSPFIQRTTSEWR